MTTAAARAAVATAERGGGVAGQLTAAAAPSDRRVHDARGGGAWGREGGRGVGDGEERRQVRTVSVGHAGVGCDGVWEGAVCVWGERRGGTEGEWR